MYNLSSYNLFGKVYQINEFVGNSGDTDPLIPVILPPGFWHQRAVWLKGLINLYF